MGAGSGLPRAAIDVGGSRSSLSWAVVHRAASELAVTLHDGGLAHGDPVVVAGTTTFETVLVVLAAWRLGASVSLVAPTGSSAPAMVAERVHVTGARAVSGPASIVDELRSSVPPRVAVYDDADVRRSFTWRAPVGAPLPAVSWPPLDVSLDDIAILQATSGTTGSHRVVPVTWRMLLANLHAIAGRLELDETDRFASWMPLYHDMGLVSFLALPAHLGARMTLLPTETFARAPGSLVDTLSATRATMTGTTTFGLAMSERALRRQREDVDLSALVRVACGAELIDLDIAERFVDAGRRHRLRSDVLACAYGMAEATLAVSIRPPSTIAASGDRALIDGGAGPATTWERIGSHGFARTGRPVEGVQLRVIDAGSAPCADGVVGAIEVRGGCVFDGYLGMTAAQSGLDDEGWFRTGDLGYVVDDEVVVVGRTKDVLVVGGRNVVPDDVERVVSELPGIRRAAAVPVLGAAGEGFGVVVEARAAASVTVRDVRVALRQALDLSPSLVEFVPKGTIPKTTSGKLRRAACRELLPLRAGPTTGGRAPADREKVPS